MRKCYLISGVIVIAHDIETVLCKWKLFQKKAAIKTDYARENEPIESWSPLSVPARRDGKPAIRRGLYPGGGALVTAAVARDFARVWREAYVKREARRHDIENLMQRHLSPSAFARWTAANDRWVQKREAVQK